MSNSIVQMWKMQRATVFQIISLTVFYTISIVYGIKCFQCNSHENPECLDLKSNDTNSTFYSDCPEQIEGNKTFCRKIAQSLKKDEETVRVSRSCGWLSYKEPVDSCWRADTDFKKERVCQCFGDGCNSSTRNQSFFSAFLVAVVLFLVYV